LTLGDEPSKYVLTNKVAEGIGSHSAHLRYTFATGGVIERTTVRLSRPTEFLLLITCLLMDLGGCSTSPPSAATKTRVLASTRYSAAYDFSSTEAVAVYEYLYKYADLDAPAIQFTLKTPQEVRPMLDGVDMDPSRAFDGTEFGTEPSAYLYARNAAGAIHQYRLVLDWGYLLDGNDWKTLRRISSPAAAALRSHLKE
jgi:hypothetical protein